MFGGLFIFGSGQKAARKQIEAIEAWWLSSKLFLTSNQYERCFGKSRIGEYNHNSNSNIVLARKLSRKNFKKKYPEYVKKCKQGCISKEEKQKMFNVFNEEETAA